MQRKEDSWGFGILGVESHPLHEGSKLLFILETLGPLLIVRSLAEEKPPLLKQLQHQRMLSAVQSLVECAYCALSPDRPRSEIFHEVFRNKRRAGRQGEQ